jgi:Helix-turn-helix of insertion element transposase
MDGKQTKFIWTPQKIKAATLIAEDTMSKGRIAEECGTSEKTLVKWRNEPQFQNRVAEIIAELDEQVTQLRFAKKRERIRALDELAVDLLTIRNERGAAYAEAGTWVSDPETGEQVFVPDPNMRGVPGGKTGRIIRQVKIAGTGKNTEKIIEHAYDSSVDKSFRETLVHIAKERGEWSDGRREFTGPNGTSLLPIIEIEVAIPTGYGSDEDEDD